MGLLKLSPFSIHAAKLCRFLSRFKALLGRRRKTSLWPTVLLRKEVCVVLVSLSAAARQCDMAALFFLKDETWKMYQLMEVCKNHYESMLEFSYTLPEHFWRYFAVQCLKWIGGAIGEPLSSDREGRIESCLKNGLLNVSGELINPSCFKVSSELCSYLYAFCSDDVVHSYI